MQREEDEEGMNVHDCIAMESTWQLSIDRLIRLRKFHFSYSINYSIMSQQGAALQNYNNELVKCMWFSLVDVRASFVSLQVSKICALSATNCNALFSPKKKINTNWKMTFAWPARNWRKWTKVWRRKSPLEQNSIERSVKQKQHTWRFSKAPRHYWT